LIGISYAIYFVFFVADLLIKQLIGTSCAAFFAFFVADQLNN